MTVGDLGGGSTDRWRSSKIVCPARSTFVHDGVIPRLNIAFEPFESKEA